MNKKDSILYLYLCNVHVIRSVKVISLVAAIPRESLMKSVLLKITCKKAFETEYGNLTFWYRYFSNAMAKNPVLIQFSITSHLFWVINWQWLYYWKRFQNVNMFLVNRFKTRNSYKIHFNDGNKEQMCWVLWGSSSINAEIWFWWTV